MLGFGSLLLLAVYFVLYGVVCDGFVIMGPLEFRWWPKMREGVVGLIFLEFDIRWSG
jgi:hypothetical protein